MVGEDHLNWVAQYLVMKRASIEPNFHTLYITFTDTLASTQLRKTMLRETYRNIKVRDTLVHFHVCGSKLHVYNSISEKHRLEVKIQYVQFFG